jgi:uncharacterized protein YndB with AHSA1/START domain
MNSTLVIEQSIVVAADRERVWRAITQPQHFSKWFGGDIQFARLVVGEAMSFAAGGESGPGRIAAVEPPERFAYYWTAEPGNPTETLVTFRLDSVPEGTLITVTEEEFEALPDEVRRKRFDMNNEGWSIQVQNIAAYLRTATDV